MGSLEVEQVYVVLLDHPRHDCLPTRLLLKLGVCRIVWLLLRPELSSVHQKPQRLLSLLEQIRNIRPKSLLLFLLHAFISYLKVSIHKDLLKDIHKGCRVSTAWWIDSANLCRWTLNLLNIPHWKVINLQSSTNTCHPVSWIKWPTTDGLPRPNRCSPPV